MRGYSVIGLVRPKTASNVGSVLRAAACYRASMVAIEDQRFKKVKIKAATDTTKAWRHIPTLRGSLIDLIPFGAVPVAIDLVDDAIPLPDFFHPTRAFYIFGPEDGTLGKSHLDFCAHRVMIPTQYCMNLAATVNVVLYDRMVKNGKD